MLRVRTQRRSSREMRQQDVGREGEGARRGGRVSRKETDAVRVGRSLTPRS